MSDQPAAAAAEPVVVTEAPAVVAGGDTPAPSSPASGGGEDAGGAAAAAAAAGAPAAEPTGEPAAVPEGGGAPAAESGKPEGPKPLLGGDDKPGEAAKPEAGEKKPEGAAPPAAPEPVKYENFTLPEGVTLDQEPLAAFGEVIGPHGVPQEAAQQLVDLHVGAMQRYAEHLGQEQWRTFYDMQRDWQQQVEDDPELGGARRDTTIAECNQAIRWACGLVPGVEGEAAEKAALRYREVSDALQATGAGNHPAMVRLWAQGYGLLKKLFTETGAPPPPMPTPPGGGGSPEQRRYGDMKV